MKDLKAMQIVCKGPRLFLGFSRYLSPGPSHSESQFKIICRKDLGKIVRNLKKKCHPHGSDDIRVLLTTPRILHGFSVPEFFNYFFLIGSFIAVNRARSTKLQFMSMSFEVLTKHGLHMPI